MMTNEELVYGILLNHYVIQGSPLAGVKSPRRRDIVVPMHRTPSGIQGPLGLLAGELYSTDLELINNSDAVRKVRDAAPYNSAINMIDRYTVENIISFHDSLVRERHNREILRGLVVSDRKAWLAYILQNTRSSGELARSPQIRRTARLVMRGD